MEYVYLPKLVAIMNWIFFLKLRNIELIKRMCRMSTQRFTFYNDKFASDEQQFFLYIGIEMVTAGGIISNWLFWSITNIPYEKISIKVKCCKAFINALFIKNNLNQIKRF